MRARLDAMPDIINYTHHIKPRTHCTNDYTFYIKGYMHRINARARIMIRASRQFINATPAILNANRNNAAVMNTNPVKIYTLIDADGKSYQSATKGTRGGHRKDKIYGTLTCKGAARWISKGHYVNERVFFADEKTAIAAGYRPCFGCLREKYKEWESNQQKVNRFMNDKAPTLIRINHNEYEAKYVGQTVDGRQFFMTNPFVPARKNTEGREFIALYVFDADGDFLDAKIDDLGSRENVDDEFARSIQQSRFLELGDFSFGDIIVAPFTINKFDVEFGLIPQAPEEEREYWLVIAEPGNYMCFYPPWGGDYDT